MAKWILAKINKKEADQKQQFKLWEIIKRLYIAE